MKRKVFSVHASAKKSWALALGIAARLLFIDVLNLKHHRANFIISLC